MEGHAVVFAAADLLRAPQEHSAEDRVRKLGESIPDYLRIVLAVDQRERRRPLPGHRLVTSSSIRVVYFSNSSVSAENWMIRSEPWNG